MSTKVSHPVRRYASVVMVIGSALFSGDGAASEGEVIWQDKVNGGLDSSDSAEAVATFGNWVFGVGWIQDAFGTSSFAVRAYDSETGELIWEDQPAGDMFEDVANAVVASASEVVVCGRLDDQFAVLAYDRKSGELLWQDRVGLGEAKDCGADGKNVFVVGASRSGVTGFDFLVRAYHSASGVLLWEDRVDGGAEIADRANAMAIAAGRLYVVGAIQPIPGDDDMVVRSYDANTGALLWHEVFAGPVGERDEATEVAVAQNKVFVAGRVSRSAESFGSEWAVHAYQSASGGLLWSDYREDEEVYDVAVRGQRVVAAGGTIDGPAVVRAYDASSGEALWEDTLGTGSSRALTVDIEGDLAYWGGQTMTHSNARLAFTVRAVDLRTGDVVWQDLFRPSDGGGRVNDIEVAAGRVFAAGHDTMNFVTVDFLLRAYRAR